MQNQYKYQDNKLKIFNLKHASQMCCCHEGKGKVTKFGSFFIFISQWAIQNLHPLILSQLGMSFIGIHDTNTLQERTLCLEFARFLLMEHVCHYM